MSEGGRADLGVAAPASLKAAAGSGVRWTMLQFGGARFITFVVFLVLARMLGPAEFGLVAIATVFVALLQFLVEGGFGQALIQREELERGHLDTVFWTSLAMGVLLAGALSLTAAPIAALYGQPLLAQILPVLSIGVVLGALGSTQTAQLRRALRFRPLGVRALISNAVAGAVSVVLALQGAGVWALVAQYVVLSGVQTLMLWTATGWRPGLGASRRHFTDIFDYSRFSLGNQFLLFANKRSDDLLIGALLGPIALGLYSVAYRLLTTINDTITQTLVGVALPVFSRLQNDTARLRSTYCRVLKVGAAVSFPVFLFFTIAAGEAVEVVFGDKWLPAAPVMAALAVFGALQATLMITDSCLNATGRPHVVFRNRLLGTIVQVGAFIVAAPFGIIWVAWALVARAYVMAPLPVWSLIRAGVVDLRGWLRAFVTPLLCTGIMIGAMAGVRVALLPHTGPGLRLAAMVGVAVLTYVAALVLIDRPLLREVLSVAKPGRRRGRGAGAPTPPDGHQPDGENALPTDRLPTTDQPTDRLPTTDQPTDSLPTTDQPTDSLPTTGQHPQHPNGQHPQHLVPTNGLPPNGQHPQHLNGHPPPHPVPPTGRHPNGRHPQRPNGQHPNGQHPDVVSTTPLLVPSPAAPPRRGGRHRK